MVFNAQICKDKDEAEVWFVGLEVAISRAHLQTPRFHSEIEDVPSFGSMSPYLPTRKSSPLISRFDGTDSLHQVGVCDILRQGCK